jgi:mannose-6-phosphate isomerase
MQTTVKSEVTIETDERPWGRFIVLEETEHYKVKRIEVSPGRRLSYQKHLKRDEHWYIVRGTAKVTLNGVESIVKTGDDVNVAAGTAHRVENPEGDGLLVFIEIQTGSYFGEDDIVRFEDDFGRI